MVAPGLRCCSYSRRAPSPRRSARPRSSASARSARPRSAASSGVEVQARPAVGDDLLEAAEPRGDDGHAQRVGLGDDPREHLVPARRDDERARSGEDLEARVARELAGELHTGQRRRASPQLGLQLARPDDPEACAAVGERPAPRVEEHVDALLGREPGEAHEAPLVVRPGGSGVGRRVVLDDDLVGRPARLQVAAAGELGGRDVGVDRASTRCRSRCGGRPWRRSGASPASMTR